MELKDAFRSALAGLGLLAVVMAGRVGAAGDPSLVGHWKLEVCAGGVAFDNSDYGNDAEVTGPSAVLTAGVDGQGMRFDSYANPYDFLSIGESPSMAFASNLTLSFWMKLDVVGQYNLVVNRPGPVRLMFINTQTTAQLGDQITRYPGIDDREWHHIAYVYEGGRYSLKLYVDGREVAETGFTGILPASLAGSTGPLVFGQHMTGTLDEIRCYTRALVAEEVNELYHEFDDADDVMNAWFRFDGENELLSEETVPGGSRPGIATYGGAYVGTAIEGGALFFDGVDDSAVVVTHKAPFDYTGDFSFSMWLLRDTPWTSSGRYHPVLTNGSVYEKRGYGLHVYERLTGNETRLELWTGNGTDRTVVYVAHPQADQWHVGEWMHVAGVLEGTVLTLYVDGQPVATVSDAVVPGVSSNLLKLGADHNSFTRHWQGALDNVKLYNYALGAEDILDDYAAMQGVLSGDPGCVLRYDFNEGTGTAVTDKSGYGYDGILYGDPAWDFGVEDGALNLDGYDDHITCSNAVKTGFACDFSFSVWLKRETEWGNSGRYHPVLGKGSPYGTDGYGLHVYERWSDGNQTRLEFWILSGGVRSTVMVSHQRSEQWHVGEWMHVAGTLEGNVQKLYVDGELAAETEAAFAPGMNGDGFMIGWNGDSRCYPWQGLVDDVSLYDRALTAAEVAGKAVLPDVAWNGCVFGLNEGNGSVTRADGIKDVTGTLVGGAAWAAGILYSGVDLDGTSGYVNCGNDMRLNNVDDFAVSVWIRRDADWNWEGVYYPLVSNGSVYDGRGYGIHVYEHVASAGYTSVAFEFWIADGSGRSTMGMKYYYEPDERKGEWMNIVGVLDGTVQKLYVDGKLERQRECLIKPAESSGDICIGWDENPRTKHWNGMIDQVGIYNQPFTDDQVATMYDAYMARLAKPADHDRSEPVLCNGEPLLACTPALMHDATTVSFTLPQEVRGTVNTSLGVYDMAGRRIADLGGMPAVAGQNVSVRWDGTADSGIRAGKGMYLVKLSAGGFEKAAQLMIMK